MNNDDDDNNKLFIIKDIVIKTLTITDLIRNVCLRLIIILFSVF